MQERIRRWYIARDARRLADRVPPIYGFTSGMVHQAWLQRCRMFVDDGGLAAPLAKYGKGPFEMDPIGRTFVELEGIKMEAFRLLLLPLEALEAKGAIPPGATENPALALAAMLHGLVGEFIDEGLLLERVKSPDKPWITERRWMTQDVIDLLLQGLLVRSGRAE